MGEGAEARDPVGEAACSRSEAKPTLGEGAEARDPVGEAKQPKGEGSQVTNDK